MTNQPEWKLVARLGDADWTEGPTYYVYVDETGVYDPELERVARQDDTWRPYEVYRVILERCVEIDGRLVNHYIGEKILMQAELPYPGSSYTEWFSDYTEGVASYVGLPHQDYRKRFCSYDPMLLAYAYIDLYDTEGWDNGDDYPLYLTEKDAEERYKNQFPRGE